MIPLPHIENLLIYEPGRPIEDLARELGVQDVKNILKLASNENLLGPSPLAIKAMQEVASSMHVYPDGGTWALREGLAKTLGVNPTQILPGNGSNELIELLGHVFLSEDTNLVMADKAFVVYRLVAAAFDADVYDVPMIDFTHDLEGMANAIDDKTRLVFIANPNNPTGTFVSGEEILKFLDRVPDHVLVVVDEAYIEMVEPSEQPPLVQEIQKGRENLIILRTFSKAYGLAGLRLGYGIAHENLIRLLNRARQPFNVNTMAQVAGLAALEDHDFLVRSRALVQSGHEKISALCDKLGLDYVPSKANFLLIKVGQGRKVFEELQKQSIIVRPMDAYGLPEYIRVTFGTDEQNQRLADVFMEMFSQKEAV